MIVTVRISITVPCENYTQPKEFKQQDNEERLNELERESSFWAIRETNRRQRQEQHMQVAKEK